METLKSYTINDRKKTTKKIYFKSDWKSCNVFQTFFSQNSFPGKPNMIVKFSILEHSRVTLNI